jgi:RHS repeat-associated protein
MTPFIRLDPYGTRSICTGSWSAISARGYACVIGYQGLMLDLESGSIYDCARFLSPLLGKFMSRDGAGYSFGANLYEYVLSNPPNLRDPTGRGPVGVGHGIGGGGIIPPPPTPPPSLPPNTPTTLYECTRPAQLWGEKQLGGTHAYLWAPGVGGNPNFSCGQNACSGSDCGGGMQSPGDNGPGSPGQDCREIRGPNGAPLTPSQIAGIMNCCTNWYSSGQSIPLVNDCHTLANGCISAFGGVPDDGGRLPWLWEDIDDLF